MLQFRLILLNSEINCISSSSGKISIHPNKRKKLRFGVDKLKNVVICDLPLCRIRVFYSFMHSKAETNELWWKLNPYPIDRIKKSTETILAISWSIYKSTAYRSLASCTRLIFCRVMSQSVFNLNYFNCLESKCNSPQNNKCFIFWRHRNSSQDDTNEDTNRKAS